MERITGPFLGHYLAAYAVPADAGYIGYAKICAHLPADVFHCTAMDKVGAQPRSTKSMALEAAEAKARLFLELLHDYHGLLEAPCLPNGPAARRFPCAQP